MLVLVIGCYIRKIPCCCLGFRVQVVGWII